MRWLIVEDSLESRRGHWFEYLEGFCRKLLELGDEVTLLVSKRAEAFIPEQLDAKPILPESAFSKMSDGASAFKRYGRIPFHSWQTFWAVWKFLRKAPAPNVIFVPTVIVHHLLAWVALARLGIVGKKSCLLLFFPTLPILKTGDTITLDGSSSSMLMQVLFRMLCFGIKRGTIVFGVETHAMKEAAEHLFSVPFTYFPHPVHSLQGTPPPITDHRSSPFTMACYGQARHEKGSDLLVKAIGIYLEKNPQSRARFVLQWMEDFPGADGQIIRLSESLKKNARVEIVNRLFEFGEHAKRLAWTQALLLPYRCSSYGLRVSRVAIEAMVNGIPMVATRGTTLAEQTGEFGATVLCEDENVQSLVSAIEEMERNCEALAAKAREQQEEAQLHFSVQQFRHTISLITKTV
jgi:glycosyltransferase involved in cell wall biosynthesis